MKKIFYKVLITIFITTIYLYPFFEDIGMGARQTSMGNTFVAVCDDVYSVYYNPAGLGKPLVGSVSFMYAQLWPSIAGEGLNDMFAGFSSVLRNNIGIGITWQSRVLQNVVNDDTISVGLGKQIKENLLLGVVVKYLKFELVSEEIKSIPELKNNSQKTAVGLDLGVLLRLTQMDVGVSLKNVNSPDVGIFESAPLPMVIKLGVSKKFEKIMVAADVSNSNNVTEFSAGGELYISEKITLRCGGLTSNAEYLKLSVGAGLQINKLQLDYSYMIQIIGGTETDTGTHRVGLSLRFK
jgi:hypothetical protein